MPQLERHLLQLINPFASMLGFDSIGDELLARVLALLPPSHLATAELCCKRWYRVCMEHGFWERHAAAAALELRHAGIAAPDELRRQQHQQGQQQQPQHHHQQQQLQHQQLNYKEKYFELKMLCALCTSGDGGYETCARVLVAHPHGSAVTACTTFDGRLATASLDKTVKIWDLATLQLLLTLPHPDPPIFLSFMGTPDLLLSATPSSGFLWRRSHLVRKLGDTGDGDGRIKCGAAWEMFFAAGMGDGSVRIYDVYSGPLVKLLRPHSGRSVTALHHVSYQDWDLLISGATGGALAITDTTSGLQLAEARALINPWGSAAGHVSSIDVNPFLGRLVATVDSFHLVSWDCGLDLSLIPTPYQRIEMDACKVLGRRTMVAASESMHDPPPHLAVPKFGGSGCFLVTTGSFGLQARGFQDLDLPPNGESIMPVQRAWGFPSAPASSGPLLLQPLHSVQELVMPADTLQQWTPCCSTGGGGNNGGSIRNESSSIAAEPGASSRAGRLGLGSIATSAGNGGAGPNTSALPYAAGRSVGSSVQVQRYATVGTDVLDRMSRLFPGYYLSLSDCSCICATQLPVVTGHVSGKVVLWRWRSAASARQL